jgi:hypothetical protein
MLGAGLTNVVSIGGIIKGQIWLVLGHYQGANLVGIGALSGGEFG